MSTVTGRVLQVPAPGGAFALIQKQFPDPGPGHVRIRVQACGVCHSDSLTKEGHWPGLQYPRVPGHEVAGIVDAVGPDVPLFKPGQRVGLGWHGGHCNYCTPCRRGDFVLCENQPISGINFDGGYADYVIAPANALAFIPDDLADADAAPLLCAGITTFNALRNSGARPGDTVAILGIGGLGHLAVQYAAKSGYRTVAIARGADKGPLAKQLGAHLYIDTTTQDPAKELQKLGGAQIILSTITSAKALEWVIDGLAPCRQIHRGRRTRRWAYCHQPLSAAARPPHRGRLALRHRHGFGRHPQIQRPHRGETADRNVSARKSGRGVPANDESGKARFRVVLTTGMEEFSRIQRLPPYVFNITDAMKKSARHRGEDIIDFGMGNPDGATPKHIVDKLVEAALKPATHRYSVSRGIPRLRKAICNWYKTRYDVDLDPETEAIVTIGSKEGIAHLCLAILDSRDTVLVPNPSYPIHIYGPVIAGAHVVSVPVHDGTSSWPSSKTSSPA
jgi:D-arabinose 1-dehydrogenase-like Zn-dependent alcohol dehydrogenase